MKGQVGNTLRDASNVEGRLGECDGSEWLAAC